MSDRIGAYQQALRELESATREAERVARVVQDAGQSMSRWKEVMVSNVAGAGFPAEIGMRPGGPSIDANYWPSAADITAALVAYHKARFSADAAWGSIPTESRVGLTPPPKWPT